ncbi:MAG TPA: ABC transporter permease [Candidatus Methylomirabilis sp.]|nr:ABC transporter permease [Candidatus Methylomirabilis sp.]
MTSFFRKLSWLARRRQREAELREELEFHLEEEAEERRANGLTGEAARYAARRDLGNYTLVQEDTRAAWGWTLLEQFFQDIRYAFRTMAASKTFSALAIVSLALGIGANTAIFSFMDSLLLRVLPVPEPESLVVLKWHTKAEAHSWNSVTQGFHGSTYHDAQRGTIAGIFPYAAFELLHRDGLVFSDVFGRYAWEDFNLSVKGQAEVAKGDFVTGGFFDGLRIVPTAGRLIVPEDDRAGAPAVVVVSHALSQNRFGSPANAIGQTVLINDVPFEVVGVAPPEFFGVDPGTTPDFYLPMHAGLLLPDPRPDGDWFVNKNEYWIEILARLRPGVSREQAQAAMAGPFHQWVEGTATNDTQRANLPEFLVSEGAGGLDGLRQRYSEPLQVLLILVGLVLAMACANIANLLLARSAARRREMAVRLSIGAGRLRVIRQLLTESVLLAFLGGALGVLVAVWGMRFLGVLLASGNRRYTLQAELNWHVLAAAALLSLLTGLFFGLAPAMQATRVDVLSALKESRTGDPIAATRRSRVRVNLSHVLLAVQVGVTLVMLVAAGLFVRTLANLQSIALGFNRENVLTFHLDARKAGHTDPEIERFYSGLREKFGALPGVRGASLSRDPLIGNGTSGTAVLVAGSSTPKDTDILPVGVDFFSTMQIPILTGRGIEGRDGPGSAPVAVVNEKFVQEYLGGKNAIGQTLTWEQPRTKIRGVEIVGVSGNWHFGEAQRGIEPIVYVPFGQSSYVQTGEMFFELRTAGNPLGYVNAVREIVRRADVRVPVSEVVTESAAIDRSMNQEITFARLCTAFGVLALVIACVGLYGTVAYNVARRTSEVGIRVALGAQRGGIVWMVLRDVLLVAGVGLAISVPVVLATSKLLEAFLFRMKPNDPVTLAAAIGILVLAAVLAGYAPARRASRIDPVVALRHE